MAKSKVFTVILILIFAFRIWQISGCKKFHSSYFNPLIIKINVESQVNLDSKGNRNLSRFFHNKITDGIFEFSKAYTSTFDLRYLLQLLGPLGLILVLIAIIKVIVHKNLIGICHFLAVLIISLISLSPINPQVIFYFRAIILFSFALWGVNSFTKRKWSRVIYLLLGIATFGYYLFSWQVNLICNEIFFK